MIHIGKYRIDNWKNTIIYDYNLERLRNFVERKVFKDDNYIACIMIFQGYDSDRKDIPNCFYIQITDPIFNYFEIINGKGYYSQRFFSSLNGAKEHVDITLNKLNNLKAFL